MSPRRLVSIVTSELLAQMKRIGGWFVDRLGLAKIYAVLGRHPVPAGTTSRKAGWMYVLGFATMVAFLLQVATGIALATKYIPSAAHAYQSIVYITEEAWLGGLLRGMHFYGASAMVVLVALHMIRVFLTGSYKYPREFIHPPDEPYLRLDVGLSQRWTPRWGDSRFEISPYLRLLNGFGRRDPLFYYFDPAGGEGIRELGSLPIVPVLGVGWKF